MAATLLFITGASRGFGRALAVECAKAYPAPLTQVLLARDESALAETARLVQEASPSTRVVCSKMDLAALVGIEASWLAAATAGVAACPGGIARAVLVNNAGSLGPLQPVAAFGSDASSGIAALQATIDANVTAPLWLSSLFLKFVAAHVSASSSTTAPAAEAAPSTARAPASCIVNISSLAAVKPFVCWATYCTGKAARDMIHACIAEECSATAGAGGTGAGAGVTALPVPLKTLNYAPGPLDTDMQAEIRGSDTLDAGSRTYFQEMHAAGKLVAPAASAAKCARLLVRADQDAAAGGFQSGSHVDYFDLP